MKKNKPIDEYARDSDAILKAIMDMPDDWFDDNIETEGFTKQEISQQLERNKMSIPIRKLENLLTLLVREKLIQTHIIGSQEIKYSITSLGQLLHFKGGKMGEINLNKSIKWSNWLTFGVALISAFGTVGAAILGYCEYEKTKSKKDAIDLTVNCKHEAKSTQKIDTTILINKK